MDSFDNHGSKTVAGDLTEVFKMFKGIDNRDERNF